MVFVRVALSVSSCRRCWCRRVRGAGEGGAAARSRGGAVRGLAAADAVGDRSGHGAARALGANTRRRTWGRSRSRSASRWSGRGRRATRSRRRPRWRAGDKTVFATVFAAAPEGGAQVVSNVFQVADDEPMQSPPTAPGQQPYPRVDPQQAGRRRHDQHARRDVPRPALPRPHRLRRAGRLLDRRHRRADRADQAGGGAEAAPDDPRRLQVRAGGDGKRRGRAASPGRRGRSTRRC